MGKVMVIFKVFANPENLDAVCGRLKKITEGSFRDLKREPIGFGIELIRVGYVIPDKTDGAMTKLEEAVTKVEGANQVEVEMATLIS
ncbi:MAG: elongation factor 1-beta [Candidatus Diapherotrites archaeon]|nr:elongation factor 1-beta [Candidatus Diapherotrites archaeon]